MMRLNTISDNPGATSARKRVGRGIGSGLGKTAGYGHKGQKARSGGAVRSFEGGQNPLYRRLPKRGFKSKNTVVTAEINLSQIQQLQEAGVLDANKILTIVELAEAGLVKKGAGRVKILGTGDVKKAFKLEVNAASEQAVAKIKAAGGDVTIK